MRTIRLIPLLASSLFLSALSYADCLKDYRANKTSGVLVSEFNILGTQTVGSDELSSITRELIGSCVNDDLEELGERIRVLFQNRGYLKVSVKNVRIKADDPLSVPKPVAIEAEVTEGPRCKFGEIRFTGNHVFPSDKLVAEFPVKKGDLFDRSKIATGLEKVIKLYVAGGYIDITIVPNSRIVCDRVDFTIDVDEGSQFRMGKLEIFAKAEQADKLRSAWGISEGAVFDQSYLEKYIENNQALLPPNFTRDFVEVVRDCRDSTVEVRLPIDQLDLRSQNRPKDVGCDPKDERSR
jgi:outer membrane protein insertion porin family